MKKITNRVIALLLVVAMLCGFAIPATAADAKLSFTKIENSKLDAERLNAVKSNVEETTYKATDKVRVSIVLEGESTIQAGYATEGIAQNKDAMEYNQKLFNKQQTMADTISAKALNGKKLDVVWNMTLVGNIISANVPYGKIETIKGIKGIKDVVIEQRYEPEVATKEEAADPQMLTSGGMIGSFNVWNNGYTGAGSRVAIIDTGSDTDHQSLDNGAFLYSLMRNASDADLTTDEYMAELDLLDIEEIESVVEQLNAYERTPELAKAVDLYLNEKLPFGYNYIDRDLDIVHDNDEQGEHGSHVAGIAVANRYIPEGDDYVDALEAVFTAGVAPDAQLITMKVFGKAGGAYDSDYMVAIEDAIILGCDSVNLSLGSGNPGETYNETYAELLDYLTTTDTVVVTSAGNASYWAESTVLSQVFGAGYLYNDGVSFAMGGTPGTFTNVLSTASVDNAGTVAHYFTTNDLTVVYNDNQEYAQNAPMYTLDTSADGNGTEYEYVLINGAGEPADYEGIDLTGKIAICSRGVTSFFEKANAAVSLGAVATIIYNNTTGAIGLNLTGYEYTAPCVSILQSEAAAMKAASEVQTTEAGVEYYTGKLTIVGNIAPIEYGNDYYTMSSFSSWGVPGNLSIKPEITAPGGGIYSLNGVDTSGKGYELMSGTSMASPQVAGMMALVAQYLRETGTKAEGLTLRALAQSLMMSTAEPLVDANSQCYYSILNQGAGLARVDLATAAESYVLVDGMPDGKVKVQLGDDPERTGVYKFGFSINNLNGEEMQYALAADFFTQNVANGGEYGLLLNTLTRLLPMETVFSVDGQACETVTVPANGSVSVEVTMTLPAAVRTYFNTYYPCGAYIQAYVYAEPAATAEGAMGVTHTIPVLGFYGSWSESSMFDLGTYNELAYGVETRIPYLYLENDLYGNMMSVSYGDGEEYIFGGNPLVMDDEYLPQRNAMNNLNGTTLEKLYFSLIRNASATRLMIYNAESGEIYLDEETGEIDSAYYYVNGQEWRYVQRNLKLKWNGTDAEGNPLPEGTKVEVAFIAAPELYRIDKDTTDWAALKDGAYMVENLTIDNTAPEIIEISANLINKGGFTISAIDNQYVAAVAVMNSNGTQELACVTPNQSVPGEQVTVSVDGITASKFQVVVYDYAMNATTYEVSMGGSSEELPYFTAVDFDNELYVGMSADGTETTLGAVAETRMYPVAAEYVDGYVFEVNADNELHIAQEDDLTAFRYISNLDPNGDLAMVGFLDLAYNKVDGKLYGLYYSENNEIAAPYLCSIDVFMGTLETICEMPIDANSLTIDEEGNFYSTIYDSSELYTYTLEGLNGGAVEADLNGDGATDVNDVYYLLNYVVGNVDELAADGDISGDGMINTYDAHLLLAMLEGGVSTLTLIGNVGEYATDSVNSLAWDCNTDELYWAHSADDVTTLLKVDVETAEPTVVATFAHNTVGLFIRPVKGNDSIFAPTKDIVSVELDQTTVSTIKGGAVQLTATVWPWTAADQTVTWTTSDEAVAVVDENGLVTGTGEGTAVITAASVLDPTKTATCEVTVAVLNRELNGIVWDEDGQVWWSKFNTDTLPAYEKLTAESEAMALNAATFAGDGKLYATDLDTSDGISKLYTIDPATFEATAIGTSRVAYFDLAAAPHVAGGTLLAPYLNYVVMIDPTTGDYSGAWDWSSSGLVGIAYAGSLLNTNYNEYMDMYYLLDVEGNLYMEAFITLNGSNYMFFGEEEGYLGNIGPAIDYEYFQSLYYDGAYLYWTRFSEAENDVDLIACDIDNTGTAYNVGSFAEGVWPVAGLINLDANPFATEGAKVKVDPAAKVMEAMSTEAIKPVVLEKKGEVVEKTAMIRENEIRGIAAETFMHDVMVDVTTDVATTNGLFEVTYDPELMTFVEGGSEFAIAGAVEEGKILIAYAHGGEISAESVLASLLFAAEPTHADMEVVVTTLERGQETELADEESLVIPFECPSAKFDDVKATSWYHDAVDFVVAAGLMNGTSETKFSPMQVMNRAQLVTILHRMVGEPAATNPVAFTDVPADAYYAAAVAWANEMGIVTGKSPTTFGPKDPVTREQMVVFFARFAKLLGIEIPTGATIEGFTDADKVSSYAVDAMAWAIENGIITGVKEDVLSPKGTSNRAQIATVIVRFLAYLESL